MNESLITDAPMTITVDDYISVRERTTDLASPLTIEDHIPQPVYFASPPKWHLAHTTWFFEQMVLKEHVANYEEFHPEFSFYFNSYYNTLGARTLRADRGSITRPGVEEVYAYRKHVDSAMKSFLSEPEQVTTEIAELIILGLNHEQQHQELMVTDFKYAFALNHVGPVYHPEADFAGKIEKQPAGWIQMEEGVYEIGFEGKGFHFDNEQGRHKVYLHSFAIAETLVTNGEFIQFIEDGGYQRHELWLDEGWSWVQQNEISHPMYWVKEEGKWFRYTLAGYKEVNPDEMLCHVSFYEANAFAQWKGMRLPTEFEWEAASNHFNWGERWEWTNSAYLAYPQFKIAEGAVGEYNGKFMINQMVLRGASCATAPGHSRNTYRNFFHPQYQWQYSGIRLAKSI